MSDIQLFRLHNTSVQELKSTSAELEKNLQSLVEANMLKLLGIRFLASEYSTGKTHRGRIDSLGIDENNCPVIIEYKRHSKENVINQGLFYLDWLLDHKAEFQWLVMEQLDKETAKHIEWSGTRLLCIAADFTKYDQHAVQQIPRNIELIRYKYFGEDLLLLELVNTQSVDHLDESNSTNTQKKKKNIVTGSSKIKPNDIETIYESIRSFIFSLGDDVTEKQLKHYVAFRKIKNIACIVKKTDKISLYLKLDPNNISEREPLCEDVRNIGHWGTGDVRINISTINEFEKIKPLIEEAYQLN